MTRAPSVCAVPGCPLDAVRAGKCDEHQRAHQREDRARYERQTYGHEWPAIRDRYLAEHPDCECHDSACPKCEGHCTEPAREVDHIIALKYFTDRSVAHAGDNLQSLCRSCHHSKSIRLDR